MIEAVGSLFFYILSAISLSFAVMVVSAQRVFRAAVALMVVLAASAGFYLLLGAEFLAGVQLLVYVGGIVVLIVFVVMLTGSLGRMDDRPSLIRKIVAALGALNFFVPVAGVFYFTEFPELSQTPTHFPGAKEIGELFLSFDSGGYVTAFELISVLLLAALVGGLVIARKEGKKIEGKVEIEGKEQETL